MVQAVYDLKNKELCDEVYDQGQCSVEAVYDPKRCTSLGNAQLWQFTTLGGDDPSQVVGLTLLAPMCKCSVKSAYPATPLL